MSDKPSGTLLEWMQRLADLAPLSHPGQQHLTSFLRSVNRAGVAFVPNSSADVLATDPLVILCGLAINGYRASWQADCVFRLWASPEAVFNFPLIQGHINGRHQHGANHWEGGLTGHERATWIAETQENQLRGQTNDLPEPKPPI